MTARYFYDIPVYRISQEKYYSGMDQHIDRVLFPEDSPYSDTLREREKTNRDENIALRHHLHRSYGGCWRFNEIIGYIRLHFLGSQIRGEYYAVAKKRIVRTRTKTLEYQTWKLAPEIEVPSDASSNDIFAAILKYLSDCRKELRGRYVDSQLFELIGPYIDWKRFARATKIVQVDN